ASAQSLEFPDRGLIVVRRAPTVPVPFQKEEAAAAQDLFLRSPLVLIDENEGALRWDDGRDLLGSPAQVVPPGISIPGTHIDLDALFPEKSPQDQAVLIEALKLQLQLFLERLARVDVAAVHPIAA